MNINSKDYWNNRFDTDWENYGGSQQTRFFATLACKMMPQWFVREIQANNYSICDMGCAFGDAVDVLSDYLNVDDVSGIDFSNEAITTAQKRYPQFNFITADITTELNDISCDVIFCSNVLEHQTVDKVGAGGNLQHHFCVTDKISLISLQLK